MAQQAKKPTLHSTSSKAASATLKTPQALFQTVETMRNAEKEVAKIGSESMECCSRAFADGAEIINDAMACRTFDDVVGVYDKVIQRTWKNYVDGANQLCSMMFSNFMTSGSLVGKSATFAQKQSSKAA